MQRKRRFCRVTCAKEMSRPPQGAYMACKQSHLSRNHGAKTVLCLGDSFPFHLHSIHLSKFTRIYPFFFPLSTFPKFTRNFGGSTAREEGALPSRQKWAVTLRSADYSAGGPTYRRPKQWRFRKIVIDPNFSTSIPLMSRFFLPKWKSRLSESEPRRTDSDISLYSGISAYYSQYICYLQRGDLNRLNHYSE